MRNVAPIILSLLILSLSLFAEQLEPPTYEYVEVTKTVMIRAELSPSSPIIMTARAGDIFKVSGQGKLWLNVIVEKNDREIIGFVPLDAVRPVDGKKTSPTSSSSHTILFILLVFGAIGGGVFFFLRRNQHVEFE